ncbi:hypothetical protein D9M70_643180 [compost metagenome]
MLSNTCMICLMCESSSMLLLVSFLNRPLASMNWVVVSVLCLDSTRMFTAMVVP